MVNKLNTMKSASVYTVHFHIAHEQFNTRTVSQMIIISNAIELFSGMNIVYTI